MSYVSTGMGYRFGVLVVSLMALRLMLVDPCRLVYCCFLSPDFKELCTTPMHYLCF